jgi:cytochrome c biogenesis protein CcmG, thiol:disulfide interchange protein DsbE
MNKSISVVVLSILIALCCKAQRSDSLARELPDVRVRTLNNKMISSAELPNEGKPFLIIFWKSCCPINMKTLDAINELYADWQDETGVTLFAVSVDDARSAAGIAPLVNGKAWDFEVLLDVNSDFKRAMNVNATPHIFILNGRRNIIWQKAGYAPGDEHEIFRILKSAL